MEVGAAGKLPSNYRLHKRCPFQGAQPAPGHVVTHLPVQELSRSTQPAAWPLGGQVCVRTSGKTAGWNIRKVIRRAGDRVF